MTPVANWVRKGNGTLPDIPVLNRWPLDLAGWTPITLVLHAHQITAVCPANKLNNLPNWPGLKGQADLFSVGNSRDNLSIAATPNALLTDDGQLFAVLESYSQLLVRLLTRDRLPGERALDPNL